MLVVTADVRAAMIEHSLRCDPHEACGLLAGPGGDVAVRFFPVRNAAESATAFTMDGREMLDAELEIERIGLETKAVVHSHPTTGAHPSPTDVADSAHFDPLGSWRSVIVSLACVPADVRCFRIVAGQIEEEELATLG